MSRANLDFLKRPTLFPEAEKVFTKHTWGITFSTGAPLFFVLALIGVLAITGVIPGVGLAGSISMLATGAFFGFFCVAAAIKSFVYPKATFTPDPSKANTDKAPPFPEIKLDSTQWNSNKEAFSAIKHKIKEQLNREPNSYVVYILKDVSYFFCSESEGEITELKLPRAPTDYTKKSILKAFTDNNILVPPTLLSKSKVDCATLTKWFSELEGVQVLQEVAESEEELSD